MPAPRCDPTQWGPADYMMLNIKALTDMTQPSFAATTDASAKVCESIAAFNSEWVAFLTRLFQENIALPQRLMSCKSLEEAQKVYVDFWMKAFAQYQEEFRRFASLGQDFAFRTSSTLEKRASDAQRARRFAA